MADRKNQIDLEEDDLLDFIGLTTGLFHPLDSFMNSDDFNSVANNYTLKNGSVFTVPITLTTKNEVNSSVSVAYKNEVIGSLKVSEIYKPTRSTFYKIFGTKNLAHPGLARQFQKGTRFVAGKPALTKTSLIKSLDILTPAQAKKTFKDLGWKTTVGFQTRNAPHLGHEHLQRIGLEFCDGLFIGPMVGWKKTGDFTETAISKAYGILMKNYYPPGRTYFHGIRTAMRYLGPREAILHAIIRRNLGCTHFIIGRDHAGVSGFYDVYGVHNLASTLLKKHDLGIELLAFSQVFFCKKCGHTVTEKSCGHKGSDILHISGTQVRNRLKAGKFPHEFMMRPQIASALLKLNNIFMP